MKQVHISVAILFSALFLFSGCDKGLNPDPSGFSGVIRFKNWPPPDSVDQQVQELRLVAFKQSPTDTSGLLLEFIKGNVVIFPPVGTPAFSKRDANGNLRDSIQYTVLLQGVTVDQPAQYAYVALAWRYGPNVFSDWRPAGLYTLDAGTFNPGSVSVAKHSFVRGIDINCDFRNPPPKPWQ